MHKLKLQNEPELCLQGLACQDAKHLMLWDLIENTGIW